MPHKSSEVSDMFDIEPRTLFVYESENLIAPERTPTQRRRYSRRDIERIRLIRELTTVHGINLAGVKVIFSLMEAAVQTRLQIPDGEFPELAGARHLPIDRLILVGNHGLEERRGDRTDVVPQALPYVDALQRASKALRTHKEVRVPGVLIEVKRVSVSVHFRQAGDPLQAAARLRP